MRRDPQITSVPSRPGLPAGACVIGKSLWSPDLGRRQVATAGTYATFRIAFKNDSGKTLKAIAPVFSNHYKTGATEYYTGNAIRVKFAVEIPSAKQTTVVRQTVTKGTFSGQRTALCDQYLIGDPMKVNIPDGTVYYLVVGVTVDTNNHYYPYGSSVAGGTNYYGIDNGEAQDTSNDVVDSGAMTAAVGAPIFAPMCMLGWFADGTTVNSWCAMGDSIVQGTGDDGFYDSIPLYGGPNKGGWAVRIAMGKTYGFSKGSFGSEKFSHLAAFLTAAPFTSTRCQVAAMHSHVLLAYGTNDLADGLTTMKLNAKKVAAWFLAQGCKVGLPTVLPQPSSSNGFIDYAGQTADTGTAFSNTAVRLAYNAWLRDTSASGAKQTIEDYCVTTYGTLPASLTVLDVCAGYEYNASGVLTLDGGYIYATGITNIKGSTAAAAGTDNNTIKGALLTADLYQGYTVVMTSGASSGHAMTVQYNNTTDIELGSSFGDTIASGDTYVINDACGQGTQDSSPQCLHPSSKGHAKIAAGNDSIFANWLAS